MILAGIAALIALLSLVTIWFQTYRKKRRHSNYLSFQLEKHHKDFTFSDHVDDGIGPVRIRSEDSGNTYKPEEVFEGSIASQKIEQTAPQWPKTLCIYIKTKPHEFFYGYDLMQSILNQGFVHGSMQFFHYGDPSKTLFSLTSIDPPGGFNLDSMGAFKTTGLCLFLQPHRFQQPVLVFEQMIHIGQQIAEDLGGVIEDEHHHLLTPERLNHWRAVLSESNDE
jgi:FtsZ-interacting cell division protein ZipA